ncbi:MAG: asparagine synthase (glutamine-hydrolyzing) [Rhodospirillales bacterium]|nr:asparagine synthase (glutamine-hydrolyzing) [Rhodospirillales bacterium]
MCGLAGAFVPRGAAPPTADIAAMLAAIRHRGPDGEGRYDGAGRRYQAGFVRLAVIDLVTGDQPLEDANGRFVLMGNGEIYNYRELRALPACRDYPFRTASDMEPILPLAAAEGEEFVHRLNGMFALALYDSAEHSLLLVRDRFGIKPLYWAPIAGGGIAFASEPKALFASGLVAPDVNEAAVSAYLAHGWVPAPMTLYKNVRKLPPGHLLKIDAEGRLSVRRYWSPRPAADAPRSAEETAEHLTALLRESVRLQLRSDVPLGVLLSGGIDSGLIAALAASELDRPLKAFTVRFEGAAYDETPLAAEVAARYGIEHAVLDVSARGIGDVLPRLAWYCDEPLADASLLPNHLIEAALGREVTVVLNGTGGDELFAGYGRYFPTTVERLYRLVPAALRRRLIEPLVATFDPTTAWKLARAEKFTSDRGGYLHDHTTLFPRPLRRALGFGAIEPEIAQARAFAEFRGPADTGALYADMTTYLPEDLLLLLDRTSMASGVEGRVPFLDHHLAEAALAVPPAIRAAGGRQKALERRMAAALLPSSVLAAPKQGFAAPVTAWMDADMTATVRRLLLAPRALARGWWTQGAIERLAAEPRRHAHRLYALAMLETAVRVHVESSTREIPECSLSDLADAA